MTATARIGVRKTPTTLATIALKIAVPMFPPAAKVCATQMLIVVGSTDRARRPSLTFKNMKYEMSHSCTKQSNGAIVFLFSPNDSYSN
jgi:hypothetical protein